MQLKSLLLKGQLYLEMGVSEQVTKLKQGCSGGLSSNLGSSNPRRETLGGQCMQRRPREDTERERPPDVSGEASPADTLILDF